MKRVYFLRSANMTEVKETLCLVWAAVLQHVSIQKDT